MPAILAGIAAGPAADQWGRKPVLLLALTGYLVLSLVLLANSVWFRQLRVEFLLLECLQDLTGGEVMFGIGLSSLLVDTTTAETRTKRFILIDTAAILGLGVGLVASTLLRDWLGWAGLFTVSTLVLLADIMFVMARVQEVPRGCDQPNREAGQEMGRESEAGPGEAGRGRKGLWHVVKTPWLGVRALWSNTSSTNRSWAVLFLFLLTVMKFAELGTQSILFLFLQTQYDLQLDSVTQLVVGLGGAVLLAQLGLLPLLTGRLQWRDTSVLLLAMSTSTAGLVLLIIGNSLAYLVTACLLGCMYLSVGSIARSQLTKLASSENIGSLFSVAGIIFVVLALVAKPSYSLVYSATVSWLPATSLLLTLSLHLPVLGLVLLAWLTMPAQQPTNSQATPAQRSLSQPPSLQSVPDLTT